MQIKTKWTSLIFFVFVIFLIFIYFFYFEYNTADSVPEEEFHAASNAHDLIKIINSCAKNNQPLTECKTADDFLNKIRRNNISIFIFDEKNFEIHINKSGGKFVYRKQDDKWECIAEKIKLNFPECEKF